MKQQNYLFVDIVSSIFLLILLIANFLGLLYLTEGNTIVSILGSMFLTVCYFFVIQLLKKNKEQMKKHRFMHSSLLFWVFFLLLGVVSFFLMSHFINVEYNCKDEVRREARQKILLVDSINLIYKKRAADDIDTYRSNLKDALDDFRANPSQDTRSRLASSPYNIGPAVLNSPSFDFNNINETVNAKVSPIKSRIENNTENLDTTIRLNSRKYQSVFDNWKRLSVMASYAKLNEYVEHNLKVVNEKIEELPLDKTPISLSFNREQLPLNSPSKLNVLYPPNYSISTGAVLLIHLFILIPFFTTKIRGGYGRSYTEDPLEIENVRII